MVDTQHNESTNGQLFESGGSLGRAGLTAGLTQASFWHRTQKPLLPVHSFS
jgi:hypothetical protein